MSSSHDQVNIPSGFGIDPIKVINIDDLEQEGKIQNKQVIKANHQISKKWFVLALFIGTFCMSGVFVGTIGLVQAYGLPQWACSVVSHIPTAVIWIGTLGGGIVVISLVTLSTYKIFRTKSNKASDIRGGAHSSANDKVDSGAEAEFIEEYFQDHFVSMGLSRLDYLDLLSGHFYLLPNSASLGESFIVIRPHSTRYLDDTLRCSRFFQADPESSFHKNMLQQLTSLNYQRQDYIPKPAEKGIFD